MSMNGSEQNVRIGLIEKYGKVSFAQLARDIAKRSGKPISRQAMEQIVSGKRDTEWLRQEIAVILEKPYSELWE